MRTNNTVIGALSVKRGEADALICGVEGRFDRHLKDVGQIIGKRPGACTFAGLSLLITQKGPVFFADTFVNYNPTHEEIAEIAVLAAQEVRRFGITPKAALICHSNFGSRNSESARKMRDALQLVREQAPDLEVDGEMQAGSALSEALRKRAMPDSSLAGEANLLLFPNLDAANISLGLVPHHDGCAPCRPDSAGDRTACAYPVDFGHLARRGQHGRACRRGGFSAGVSCRKMRKCVTIASPAC